MKKYINILTLVLPILFFTNCTESDDEFFAVKSVTANNLIDVNASGNVLNISCNIDRMLAVGNEYPLDLFTTTNSRKFFFNYSIQKKNTSGNWDYFIPENVSATIGENLIGSYISGVQVLDMLDTTYEYDTDITLEPGQYRILVDPKIVSANSQNVVTVIINSTVIGGVGNSLEFTVI